MPEEENANTIVENTDQSKTISLFQFIRELNKLKQRAILNIKDYPWTFALSDLPDDHDNISIFFRDRVEDEDQNKDSNNDRILLSVHKPEFQKCPEPELTFKDWLLPGWDNYRNESKVKESIELQIGRASCRERV